MRLLWEKEGRRNESEGEAELSAHPTGSIRQFCPVNPERKVTNTVGRVIM